MNAVKLLNDAQLKCTRQRIEIITSLYNAQKPMTAEEIHLNMNGAAVSTVYRNIEKLLDAGVITKTTIPKSGGIYYELSANEHRHCAICLKCHKLRYIDTCPISGAKTIIQNFTVTSHKLELYGYCSECTGK